jgi:Peptidase_C39 like family
MRKKLLMTMIFRALMITCGVIGVGRVLAPINLSASDGIKVADVTWHLGVLPDGRVTLVVGDPVGCKRFNHRQGDNYLDFENDCGLVACEDILRQFGYRVGENDVVRHAVDEGECDVVSDSPQESGGTSVGQKVKILADYGVEAEAEAGLSLEDLASAVEHGYGVIASVNAGYLWNKSDCIGTGAHNHAITITGVARDPRTHQIQGFFINDSGTGESGEFVTAETMERAWLLRGLGVCIVTEHTVPSLAA